jgi:hypothetical protein
VRRDGQVWIVRPDGSVVDSIAPPGRHTVRGCG